jgi:hypothetical protein
MAMTDHSLLVSARPAILPRMAGFLVSAAVLFVAAGVLAVTTGSSWPLLVVRVVLIALGIVLLVVGLRQRRRMAS